MKKEIEHEDVQSIFDLETELFPCLVDMRFLRVTCRRRSSSSIKTRISIKKKKCLQEVKKETGIDTQIWAARSIAQVLIN